jgi:hypothetical protein
MGSVPIWQLEFRAGQRMVLAAGRMEPVGLGASIREAADRLEGPRSACGRSGTCTADSRRAGGGRRRIAVWRSHAARSTRGPRRRDYSAESGSARGSRTWCPTKPSRSWQFARTADAWSPRVRRRPARRGRPKDGRDKRASFKAAESFFRTDVGTTAFPTDPSRTARAGSSNVSTAPASASLPIPCSTWRQGSLMAQGCFLSAFTVRKHRFSVVLSDHTLPV